MIIIDDHCFFFCCYMLFALARVHFTNQLYLGIQDPGIPGIPIGVNILEVVACGVVICEVVACGVVIYEVVACGVVIYEVIACRVVICEVVS